MLECLLCIASVYISGSIGYQDVEPDYYLRSNHYGAAVGNASLTVELGNNLFFRLNHTSGVNEEEPDWGLNTVEIGGKIYLYNRSK